MSILSTHPPNGRSMPLILEIFLLNASTAEQYHADRFDLLSKLACRQCSGTVNISYGSRYVILKYGSGSGMSLFTDWDSGFYLPLFSVFEKYVGK
jgi:hypothetical protein